MRYYETLYLINPNLGDEDYRNVIEKYNRLIEENNGVIVKVDEWGKKSLAYPVKKFDRGFYVLLQYCGEPDLIAIIRRDLRLDERVLKFQTVKLSDTADVDALTGKSDEDKAGQTEASKAETPPDTETKDDSGDQKAGDEDV